MPRHLLEKDISSLVSRIFLMTKHLLKKTSQSPISKIFLMPKLLLEKDLIVSNLQDRSHAEASSRERHIITSLQDLTHTTDCTKFAYTYPARLALSFSFNYNQIIKKSTNSWEKQLSILIQIFNYTGAGIFNRMILGCCLVKNLIWKTQLGQN